MTSEQRLQQPALQGYELDTPRLLTLVSRLEGVSLPEATLHRWIRSHIITPSIHRRRRPGQQHQWAIADAALVSWLARLRAEGLDITQYERGLRSAWPRLVAGLERYAPPLYLAIIGRDTAVVMTADEVLAFLRAPVRTAVVLYPALSLELIRLEASSLETETP